MIASDSLDRVSIQTTNNSHSSPSSPLQAQPMRRYTCFRRTLTATLSNKQWTHFIPAGSNNNDANKAGSNSAQEGGRTRSTKGSSAGWRCTGAATGTPSGFLYPLAASSRSKNTASRALPALKMMLTLKRYVYTAPSCCHVKR